jgi:type IV pilus assembly protein PilM
MHSKPTLLPALLRPRLLAVDCGARHVACGLFASGAGGRLVLRQLAVEAHSPDPNLKTSWSESIGRALANIAGNEKLGGGCRLALPGHHTLVKFVRSSSVEKASRAGVIEFEAQNGIPCPLEQVVWDHLPVVENGSEFKFMLAAVKNEVAGAVHGAAGASGFVVSQMVPSCVALFRAFRYAHPRECVGVLVVEIGARSTHLVYIEGERFFVRTFPLGGDTVTQAVADELHLDFVAAETLKIQALSGRPDSLPGAPAHGVVRHACAHFAERLRFEIVRSTISYRCYSGAAQPVSVHLTGGGSLIPELPVLLADKLALRVVRFEPLRSVRLAPRACAGAETAAPMLAGLVGLGTSLIAAGWPALNLLPRPVIKAQAARRRQPVLLTAAFLAASAPLPVIWQHQRVSGAIDQAAAAVDGHLVPLRTLAARNATNLTRIEETRRQINGMRSLAGSKSNWIAFLNDLQDRLTQAGDAWLEKLQVAHPSDGTGRVSTGASAQALRFNLSGRLLDKDNPVSKVGTDSYVRARSLLQLLSQSPFIAGIENERFDNTQPGILRFDFTLVPNPAQPL